VVLRCVPLGEVTGLVNPDNVMKTKISWRLRFWSLRCQPESGRSRDRPEILYCWFVQHSFTFLEASTHLRSPKVWKVYCWNAGPAQRFRRTILWSPTWMMMSLTGCHNEKIMRIGKLWWSDVFLSLGEVTRGLVNRQRLEDEDFLKTWRFWCLRCQPESGHSRDTWDPLLSVYLT
jgi:hypothetical protein